jgi:hypothetical protein
MQEVIAQHIEILEVPVNNVNRRFYLPFSSRLINRKIKHILSFAGSGVREFYSYTPSGRVLIPGSTRLLCYISLASKSGLFAKDIPLSDLDVNMPYYKRFDRKLEMEKCYISVTDKFNIGGSAMLAFIYDAEPAAGIREPNCVETIDYPLTLATAPEILSLGRIEKLANKKISRIEVDSSGLGRSCFLTLVTRDNKVLSDIPFSVFDGKRNPNRIYLDNILSEINFERSFIRISNKYMLIANDITLRLNFFYNDK